MSEIVIYEDGSLVLETTVKGDTVWLNQKQMEKLFGRERSVISKHIKNVFNEGELEEGVVCANFAHTTKHGAIEGKVQSKNVKYYSLDVVISVGYRVKSKNGTQFRIWANSVLKEYIIKGYALNQERLKEEKLRELEQTISLIKQGLENKELSLQEAKGFVEIVSNYAKSWALLQGYLMILLLHQNGILYKANAEAKINDNALASLALLVATSAPEQKDIIIKLVMNMLLEGE
ncbi:MAG: phage killer protein [Sulfurovum sp.]|nr:MAG: phage killer protein [Sulfurovum sp.]